MTVAKFIIVTVGLVVLWLKQNTEIDIGEAGTQQITDLILMILIATGVYTVPNAPKQ